MLDFGVVARRSQYR